MSLNATLAENRENNQMHIKSYGREYHTCVIKSLHSCEIRNLKEKDKPNTHTHTHTAQPHALTCRRRASVSA